MKKIIMCALVAVLVSAALYAQNKKTQTAPAAQSKSSQTAPASSSLLKTEKDRLSYSIGMNLGAGLKEQAIDVNSDMLLRGIKDAISDGKPLMTDEEIRASLSTLKSQLQAKQAAIQEKAASENKAKGDKFLAENKTKEGVVALPSGLQYKILKAGTGAKPKATDTVTTHYKGTLLDGTQFDSSYDRNEPATFPVSGVIKGWTEALQLMPVGSKWQLFIPAELAYGERGAAQVIGPNETLIFEVELLSIQDTKEAPKK